MTIAKFDAKVPPEASADKTFAFWRSAATVAPSAKLAVCKGTPPRSPRSTNSLPGTKTRYRAGQVSPFRTPVSTPRLIKFRKWYRSAFSFS